ncbi:thioredoxin domain-containing protein [Qipengyuania sp. CAU 1752]
MTFFRRAILTSFAAPLALGIAACSDSADETAEITGEPVAEVAPPEGQQWSQVTQLTEQNGHLIGNPDAPIKVVEYGSLTCGTCAQFTQTGFEPLREEYIESGRVSFELRPFILNGLDLVLVRLARCGSDEAVVPLSEAWWNDFQNGMSRAQADQEAVGAAMDSEDQQTRYIAIAEAAGMLDFFAARGISRDQARTCLSDPASIQAIAERSRKQGEELGITGTPTFFVNGRKLQNVVSWEELEPILQKAGAR